MPRVLLILAFAILPAGGAQINQFVNCGGATQDRSTNESLPSLICRQNGFVASAIFFGPGALEAFTMQTAPEATGPVEAQISADGLWSLTVTSATQNLFWSVCLTSTITGSGTGSVSGTLGAWSLGQPCDFAHALPIQSDVPVLFREHDFADASSGATADLRPQFLFFDQNGGRLSIAGFDLMPGALHHFYV